jgi:hypothetical protein
MARSPFTITLNSRLRGAEMRSKPDIRGNRADYDEWAAAGATGWSYDFQSGK